MSSETQLLIIYYQSTSPLQSRYFSKKLTTKAVDDNQSFESKSFIKYTIRQPYDVYRCHKKSNQVSW